MFCFSKRIHLVPHFRRLSEKSSLKHLIDNAATFEDPNIENHQEEWATLPYPTGTALRRQQSSNAVRPKIDPRQTSIILFPGQGSQYVGMAKSLLKYPMARDLFELANYTLRFDLLKLCTEGPQSELNKTEHCQLAVFVTSLAALEKLKEERPNAIDNCIATAGFSLGELTALVFAGAIQFEKALKLIQVRAQAMQIACDAIPSAMITVFYGPDSRLAYARMQAKKWCQDNGVENPECSVANYLYPHCKVVAGHEEAIQFIEKNAKQFKLKKLKRISVSGAFHTELMRSAVDPFRKALRKLEIKEPMISVHSNIDGKRYKNVAHIIQQLPKQLVKPVKWEQTIHVMYERNIGEYFPRTFVCGPGNSLRTILKQVNAKAWNTCHSLDSSHE